MDVYLHLEVNGLEYWVSAIYRDDKHGSTTFEVPGPKRYLRVWDGGSAEWTWQVHDEARRVYADEQ